MPGAVEDAVDMLAPRFFDDAALFPPGLMPIDRAVVQHRVHRRAGYRDLVGLFVVGTPHIEGLFRALEPAGHRIEIALSADADAVLPALRRLSERPDLVTVRAVEVRLGGGGLEDVITTRDRGRRLGLAADDTQWWVETPVSDSALITTVAEEGFGVKLRLGGLRAEDIPSPAAVAGALETVVRVDARLKLTAGLHRAAPYADGTGSHHGFANILVALSRLESGADEGETLRTLETEDHAAVTALVQRHGLSRRVRSIGTCSLYEPLSSSSALGLISPVALPRPEMPGQRESMTAQYAVPSLPGTSIARRYATEGYGSEHLPYGSVEQDDGRRFLCIRIGDQVLDLGNALADPAVSQLPVSDDVVRSLSTQNLDALLRAGRTTWTAARAQIEAMVQDDAIGDALARHLTPLTDVRELMPFTVVDYVDFYASQHHAENVGKIFRPANPALPPQWTTIPIGYHGRAQTVAVTGTPVRRPSGVRRVEDRVGVGPSTFLDFEAELGFVVGGGPERCIPVEKAEELIFGVVLVNDWSARDLQAYEYQPLGPFLGKSFLTSISAWVTPLEALDGARCALPARGRTETEYLPLPPDAPAGIDIDLTVRVNDVVVSRPPYRAMHFGPAQMLAHLTHNGATAGAGDFFASGTVSGPERDESGSLLELTWNGTSPVPLSADRVLAGLEDGDRVEMTATAVARNGEVLRLGGVSGKVSPGL